LPSLPHPSFKSSPIPYTITQDCHFLNNPGSLYGIGELKSNKISLAAALEAVDHILSASVKPVLIAGPKLRVAKAQQAFEDLATASAYAVAVMPSGKGLFRETHPGFIGTYWGAVSTAFVSEIVESSDVYVFVGPIFNDYSSVGYSLLCKKEKTITIQPDRIVIGNGQAFGAVLMKDFLEALSKRVKRKPTSFDNYMRMYVPPGLPLKQKPNEPLKTVNLFHHIQELLSPETAVIAETGDSWFNCQKLKLPDGCGYEFQMQYGSIGWSVGATLGYAQSVKDSKRVIACIGDGSFQMTAQDVSTMIRCGQRSVIFLINNGGYTIEVEIHDGPYNIIKNWNYTGVVEAFANGEGNLWTTKVRTEEELVAAITTVQGEKKDSLCFIEVILHKDDTSKELLEWGSRVAAANGRPPNPQ
jgi:pyruvate decarboxylase